MKTNQKLYDMLEALINENSEAATVNFHEYLSSKMQGIIMGENCDGDMDDDDDDDDDKKDMDYDKDMDKKDDKDDKDADDKEEDDELNEMFAQPTDGSMSKKIKGKVGYKRGGKKTAKKHGNSAKGLDCDKVDKFTFKRGGKKTAKTLEPIKTPSSFNDGRDMPLGTT